VNHETYNDALHRELEQIDISLTGNDPARFNMLLLTQPYINARIGFVNEKLLNGEVTFDLRTPDSTKLRSIIPLSKHIYATYVAGSFTWYAACLTRQL
jgi:hypothetical protein